MGNAGWIDFDPTRGNFADNDYVTISIGRDYSDVAPNRGVWKGHADETIRVMVKVEPIERVPLDWSDWSDTQDPWSAASWMHSNPRSPRMKLSSQAGYRQQQGQQQQSRPRSGSASSNENARSDCRPAHRSRRSELVSGQDLTGRWLQLPRRPRRSFS
jgi:hypothetical protein